MRVNLNFKRGNGPLTLPLTELSLPERRAKSQGKEKMCLLFTLLGVVGRKNGKQGSLLLDLNWRIGAEKETWTKRMDGGINI